MSLPKILIIYKEKESLPTLSKLLSLLTYFCPLTLESSSKTSLPTVEIKEGEEYPISISTKYYDALTQAIFYQYHPDDAEDILSAVENINVVIHFFEQEEKIDEYLKFVQGFTEKAEAEISLLVYNGAEEKLEDKYEKRVHEICIEVFLEFIRTDVNAKFVNPVLEKQGMLAEGKVGIDRLVEALQCNMWPNMVRKPMDDIKAQMMKELKNEEEEEKKEIENEQKSKDIDEEEKVDDSSKQPIKSEPTGPTPLYTDPLNPLLPIPDYSKTCHETEKNNFEEEERNLEELGSLMSQMANLKDSVKGMSLEERRDNAESMIKKIAGFMDLGEEEGLFDSEDEVDYDEVYPDEPKKEAKTDEQQAESK